MEQPATVPVPAPGSQPDLAIVVVTYRRQDLLRMLLESIEALTVRPGRIIVVDNEGSGATREIVESFRDRWGSDTRSEGADGVARGVVYAPQSRNLGGAGGFSAGTRIAYDGGARWIWVMDDDVAVVPEAIERLRPWMRRFKVIQGSRLDYDGSTFYWQYRFNTALGIPNPVASSAFPPSGFKPMNTACFEGGLFHRSVVQQIGLPDPRFFIYWDDTVYGWLASTVTRAVLVQDVILQRSRDVQSLDLGVRQLRGTSDMTRYHILRNRGLMARYFATKGALHRPAFALGTVLSVAKELIRLVAVDRSFRTGLPAIIRGVAEARRILRDPDWRPMPPLA